MATTKFGLAQPVRRVEDPRLLNGRAATPTTSSCPACCTASCCAARTPRRGSARIDTAAAASLAGVKAIYTAADLKADGIGGAALRRAGAEPRRHRPGDAAASGAGGRHGAPCRRSGGVRRRRHRQGRRATPRKRIEVDYDILPSVTDHGEGDGPGRAAGLAGRRAQHRVRLGDRRQGGDRGAVRQGRACHQADGGEQPHRRLVDGSARRDRRLRCGDRPLDAVCQHPGRLAGEEPDRRRCSTPIRRSSASSRPMSAAASA